MKTITLILLFIIISSMSCYSEELIDEIHLKDSTTILGTISKLIPDKHVFISTLDGDTITIPMNKISKITKIDKWSIDIYDKNYFELGVNLGTPGFLNFYVGYWYSPIGLSVSGWPSDKDYALQTNIRYKLSDTYSSCSSLSFVLGAAKWDGYYIKNQNRFYWGLAFNYNYRDFWFELGFANADNRHSGNEGTMLFQIGYTCRFL